MVYDNGGRGRLITFEGIDGSGKTTHLKRLAAWLEAEGYEVLVLREPGGTPIGEQIREILLDRGNAAMAPLTELLLFEAARAQIVAEVIEPALRRGAFVVLDRFTDSTLAYQGYGRGLGPELVAELNDLAVGDVRPDLTFLLEAPDALLKDRVVSREGGRDRMEAEDRSFRQRTLDGFAALAAAEPERVIRIETSDDKETTSSRIIETVRRALQ